ncbi:MAG: hypothetical protein BYD32DRAFT_423367 [Podila humilis]|nr:MAG: hypothetical protein BYD32DRAFT_423367 [Podila humilis]
MYIPRIRKCAALTLATSLVILLISLQPAQADYGCPGYVEDCIEHCQEDEHKSSGFCVPMIAGSRCICY